jgi:Eukaryotic protein of unknown function (DUF1764)
MSEIDDIFATKGKAKATSPVADASSVKKSKKKKSKRQKNDDQPKDEVVASSSSKKRKAPETVVDPSQIIEGTAKRQKSNSEAKKSASKKEEAKFKDSRGTGGRKCPDLSTLQQVHIYSPGRTTEEGFAIYKEDELGISHEGGGKPAVSLVFLLFMAWHQTLRCVPSIATAVSNCWA